MHLLPDLRGFEDYLTDLMVSPERVDPGNETWHTRNTPKVIGGITKRCAEVASALVLFAYVGVACQWMLCYEMYEIGHVGGAGAADFARVDALAQYLPVF